MFLVKQSDGSFELTVPLPPQSEKLLYKYVVDGEWLISSDDKVTKDDSGIENNYLTGEDLVSVSTAGTAIPEAGGLPVKSTEKDTKEDVKTTVMPKEEPKQATMGEPGIAIPQDAETLKAFETVRDVDPKTLNEPELSAEEKKKQKKKVKRSQYKAKKKKKAAGAAAGAASGAVVGAVSAGAVGATAGAIGGAALAAGSGAVSGTDGTTDVTGTEESAENTPEPESETSGKKIEEPVSASTVGSTEEEKATEVAKEDPIKSTEAVIAAPLTENNDTPAPETKDTPVAEPVTETKEADVPETKEAEPVAETKESEPVPETNETEPVAPVAAAVAEPVTEKPAEPVAEAEKPTEPVPVADTVVKPSFPSDEAVQNEDTPVPENKDDAAYHSLDPNAEGKEVEAEKVETEAAPVAAVDAPVDSPAETAPVAATPVDTAAETPATTAPVTGDDEEIVIAQGKGKNIEAQILAQENGDVTIEEIQPTESERAKFTEEANLSQKSGKSVDAVAEPVKETKKETPKKEAKKESPKKKKGFFSKLKKIFN